VKLLGIDMTPEPFLGKAIFLDFQLAV
jgi:hypothetical protein